MRNKIECEFSRIASYFSFLILLKNRMSAALTVVGSFVVAFAVVVIENKMFAFKTHDIGNAV